MSDAYNRPYKAPSFEDTPMGYKHTQIGGDHYTSCGIQPADYAIANGFNYYESFALKYITRHRKKNGAEDLRKAIHCLQLLLEQEYERGPDST